MNFSDDSVSSTCTVFSVSAANHVNRTAECPAAATAGKDGEADGVSALEEHSNGLRDQGKERNGGRSAGESEEQAAASQVTPNERTHSGKEEPSDTSRVNDTANVKEEGGCGAEAETPPGASAASDRTSNELDFDLSSDSDSDPVAGHPSSSGSEGDGKAEGLDGAEPAINADGGVAEKQPAAGEDGVPLATEQESLRELGNGCQDKKEAETESQNSEQSGVTMGEESLDQSMEEEEEEEPDLDQDDHLIYLEEILARIHREYFARYDDFLAKKSVEVPDIRKIVPELKSKSLEGMTIVFSGLYPTNYPMERTRECYHAKALGAKIGKNLLLSSKDPNRTTHLIAARAGGCPFLFF